ncbi:unnamed protein product, partial [Owenia fusiformis]
YAVTSLYLSTLEMDIAGSMCMTYEAADLEYEEFPQCNDPVTLLGEKYSTIYDLEDIKHDFLSRLWFTYRRGFSPIGGTGPTGDTGWGCMLRCGQMMLAQALLLRHLGRDWRWQTEKYDPKYWEIVRMFQDKKNCCYSIHQIASMGVSEGKSVGQWYGPNTIAQVMKKLAVYDEWSSLVVHVAMDNTVIEDDIRVLCSCKPNPNIEEFMLGDKTNTKNNKQKQNKQKDSTSAKTNNLLTNGDCSNSNISSQGQSCQGEGRVEPNKWRPLLLIIPLRLGLTDINMVYAESLKTCLSFRQSVGFIGGKPNHALWFNGHFRDELIYLDPHTTQPAVNLDSMGKTSDETYHCPYTSRMRIKDLDPSVAVGFFCANEADFNDLCQTINKFILSGEKTPMFELHKKRPAHWPPFEPHANLAAGGPSSDYVEIHDRQYDSDDEFELL